MKHIRQKKMSYLSIALQRQTERRHLNQSDIARGANLSRSYISRLFSGESHELSDQNFSALLKIFAADPLAQAELVAARCQDAKAAAIGTPGADLVEIKVKAAAPAEKPDSSFPQVHLSQETERAFAWLRSQCPVNPDLEKHLVGYARLTGMK
jgi:transcriptional regulator with XRE-family HTH domain